jgi:hypothetical protein
MPTSWNDTLQIETYLDKGMSNGDALVFEVRLILEPNLVDKIKWQQKAYTLIKSYGRQQLKQEIELVHEQLFTQKAHAGFSQKIKALFKIK